MAVSAKVITNWFATDPLLGMAINLTETISTTTNPETPAARQALGTAVKGNSESVWMFVQASTTVTSGNVVAIDANYQANDMSSLIAASLAVIAGVAQFQAGNLQSTLTQNTAQPGDFFWACLEAASGLQINSTGSCLRGTQLFISSATPGSVTSSVSTTQFQNIYANTTFAPSGSNSVTDFICLGQVKVSQ
jgi:hypothetical protein